MTLNVPFQGTIPIPATNYSSTTLPDGSLSYRTMSHYEAAVTGLEASGSQLEIVLGMEKWSASVKFDVSKAVAWATNAIANPTATDPLDAARARVKSIDRKLLNETLWAAAHGNDIAFFGALLEVGADPKSTSENGWTALMVAAAYGTADMVDAL